MPLFGHHAKSYLGLDIEINDRPFPDGMVDHVVAFAAVMVLAYGIYALVRDLLRWWQKQRARAVIS